MWELKNNILYCNDISVLSSFNCENTLIDDNVGTGVFIKTKINSPTSEITIKLGNIENFHRSIVSYRKNPYFGDGLMCKTQSELPHEIQWLMTKRDDDKYVVVFPFIDEYVRSSLCLLEGELAVKYETGSSKVTFDETCCIYVGLFDDPLIATKCSARSVAMQSQTVRLRAEKAKPKMLSLFGWCTWDSFYHEVSEEKVLEGLKSFEPLGYIPKFLILDDGWLTTQNIDNNVGFFRLSDFKANEKFPKGLKNFSEQVKEKGVDIIYVWHALYGYWGGISKDSPVMAKYFPTSQPQKFHKDLTQCINYVDDYVTIAPENMFEFYNDFHSYLRKAGIDGVKVDVQSYLESVGENYGGRVCNSRKVHNALEASVKLNFNDELLNCMSNANDTVLSTLNSNLMRSSNDFFPNNNESHGRHIYTNAINSLFLSEFTYVDWDMFQTKHPMGEFHATARAIYGGPVYVSDKVGEHNFEIIKRLTDERGNIIMCQNIARPTLDSLFSDPFNEKTVFKIYNSNNVGGVIGAFNFNSSENENNNAKYVISPNDVYRCGGEEFIVYSFFGKTVSRLKFHETKEFSLDGLKSEIFSVTPLIDDFSPIGIADKYNVSGTIAGFCIRENEVYVNLKTTGEFLAYSENSPKNIYDESIEVPFTFENNIIKTNIKTKSITLVF